MAKSKETYQKKDKEQRRSKQKQEKKQKMEDRKANKTKGNGMAGMMAYLDENGNLTDVPRDPMIKKVFKQEEIQIGVPKFEDRVEVVRKGVVSFFNKPKGFGFINDLDTKERIFFHVNEILEAIEESDTVQFQVQQGPRGLSAAQVTKLK